MSEDQFSKKAMEEQSKLGGQVHPTEHRNLRDLTSPDASLKPKDSSVSRPMTFGEKAVGLTFNPSGHVEVEIIKRKCADLIDELQATKELTGSPERKRMYSIAITELQTAQMWAVKAATWKD